MRTKRLACQHRHCDCMWPQSDPTDACGAPEQQQEGSVTSATMCRPHDRAGVLAHSRATPDCLQRGKASKTVNQRNISQPLCDTTATPDQRSWSKTFLQESADSCKCCSTARRSPAVEQICFVPVGGSQAAHIQGRTNTTVSAHDGIQQMILYHRFGIMHTAACWIDGC
jgi:hypothetical protein